MKKWGKLAIASTMGISLLASPLSTVNKSQAQRITAENVLSQLTPEQMSALHQLEVSQQRGLMLNPETDLTSDEIISVIVEFETATAQLEVLKEKVKGKEVTLKKAQQQVENSHEDFKHELSKRKESSKVEITRTFQHAFNGVSLDIPANEVKGILDLKNVKAVYTNSQVKVDPPENDPTVSSDSSSIVNESIPFLGIDRLHAEGITGDGIKVGVLDTGVDYHHPDLKEAYKGGYDFIDNDSDPMEATYQEWKDSGRPEKNGAGTPYYTYHGTHVSGTIVGQNANDSEYATLGVAPEADLYAYRVLGPYGTGAVAGIVAGIDQAIKDGMDVINLSLGVATNDPLFPASIAINNAVLSGVTAVVAAGNSGSNSYTLGSPGTAALGITVGASDMEMSIATSTGSLTDGENTISTDMRLLAKGYNDDIPGMKGKEFPLIDVGLGAIADYDDKNVDGKIVLVERGEFSLNEKIENAKKQGASGVILWNNSAEEGYIPHYLGEGRTFISTFATTKEQGMILKEFLKKGNASFTFDGIGEIKSEGDQLASFSSRGPVYGTYDIKPEVTAPGVSIMSSVPSYMQGEEFIGDYQNAYQRANGTSMATPHVAGIAALMLQNEPGMTPEDIKSKLMNTADSLKEEYSVYEVGAGRVDPYEAIHADTVFQVMDKTEHIIDGKPLQIDNPTGAMNFGLHVNNKNLREQQAISIENKSEVPKNFDVEVSFTSQSMSASKNGVKIVTDDVVKVKAGKKINSNVFLVGHKKGDLGSYEGYITYTNRENPEETYKLPFAFRYVEEGVEDLRTYIPVMSDSDRWENFAPIQKKSSNLIFKMTAPTERVDVFLVDGQTGEELGYVAGADVSNQFEGYYMQMAPLLGYGKYYPFTGNSNHPIAENTITAPPGHYQFKLVATGKSGKVTSKSLDIYIDNNPPEMELDIPSQIIEYEKGKDTYSFTGSIQDLESAAIEKAGLNMEEVNNQVTVYPYTNAGLDILPLAYVAVDENGDFGWDIPLDKPVKQVRILGQDEAGNGLYNEAQIFTFVEEGTPYMQTTTAKKTIEFNESFQSTVSVKNAKNWVGGTFKIAFRKGNLDLTNIEVHPDLEKVGNVSITTENSDSDALRSYVTVSVKVEDGQTINGNINLLDLEMKGAEMVPIDSVPASLRVSEAKATLQDGEEIEVISDAGAFMNITPTYSSQTFLLNPEGIKAPSKNMNESGAEIRVQDDEGKTYDGFFQEWGGGPKTTHYYEASKIPLTSKKVSIEAKVPGHTTADKTVEIGRNYKGKWIGTVRTVDVRKSYGGDVNGDEVIDIMDGIMIQNDFGTDKRNSDINFDGVVDLKDFAFVEKNFMFVNPGMKNTPPPKERHEGQTLETIKEKLENL
jgi:subtilisin family serine protease